MAASRPPVSTYRLQLHAGFGFEHARALLDSLIDLGITDLYLSPILKARPGSLHGYDVVDPTIINPELGGEEAFRTFAHDVRSRGMGLLLDIVPNHMAISPDNPAWMDVLASGRESEFARWFDINWEAPHLAVPVLGKTVEEAIRDGDFTLECIDGHGVSQAGSPAAAFRYFEWRFPLNERSHREIVSLAGADDRSAIERASGIINERRKPDDPAPSLHSLLQQQHYRPAHWKLALRRLTYRRFFDITHLIGVRVEDPDVFLATHTLIIQLVQAGLVTGLRIDHIDGLADPLGYLRRLSDAVGDPAFYVIVEKILGGEEPLDERWPVAGTTGYDYLNAINGVFIDAGGLETLAKRHAAITGVGSRFDETVYELKKRIASELFGGEVDALVTQLVEIAAGMGGNGGTPSREDIESALIEVSACLPVYRTYINDGERTEQDRGILARCFDLAERRCSEATCGRDLLCRVLLEDASAFPRSTRQAVSGFITHWQQFTGPLMAKGLEDTALYRDARLISLNTVGMDPKGLDRPRGVEDFHHHNRRIRARWPNTMNATSTHDTKRSEDVRARIHALSEIADEWLAAADRWLEWNAPLRQVVNEIVAPAPLMELFLYQSMLGAWPFDRDEQATFLGRLVEYAVKAAREAKADTDWIEPNEPYESALAEFVRGLLVPQARDRVFFRDFLRLVERIAWPGAMNSLSRTVLKIASPGVPDFYQGTELWNFSLVDPDNRRPVDFELRRRCLRGIEHASIEELLRTWRDGRIKMFVTARGLNFRRERASLLLEGEYLALAADGERAAHFCAFARRHEDEWLIVIAPILTANLAPPGQPPLGEAVWGETRLPLPDGAPRRWRNVITGEDIASKDDHLMVADVLRRLPVAMLHGR